MQDKAWAKSQQDNMVSRLVVQEREIASVPVATDSRGEWDTHST